MVKIVKKRKSNYNEKFKQKIKNIMTCEFKKQLKISECMVFKQTHTQ